jgi:predicted Zn-dependent protease
MGLIFMAMAGYNPREAVDFWQRMKAESDKEKPPAFLSTHPPTKDRINDLQSHMDEALKYYSNNSSGAQSAR